MNPDELRQTLEFYRDLGVTDLYRATPASEVSREFTQIKRESKGTRDRAPHA